MANKDVTVSYRVVALGACAVVVSLVGYLFVSGMGKIEKQFVEVKDDLREIRKDTADIPLIKHRLDSLEKDVRPAFTVEVVE